MHEQPRTTDSSLLNLFKNDPPLSQQETSVTVSLMKRKSNQPIQNEDIVQQLDDHTIEKLTQPRVKRIKTATSNRPKQPFILYSKKFFKSHYLLYLLFR